MRVTNIDLYSSDWLIANFSFRDPALLDQYLVKGITGLDAESITPRLYGKAIYGQTINGQAAYYNMILDTRTIVMRLIVNPRWDFAETYANLRDYMYRAVSRARTSEVALRLNDGDTTLAIVKGFMTKFEAVYSTDQPEIQLTIVCKDPWLRSEEFVEVPVAGLSVNNPVISDYLSTAPHGCQFQFKVTTNLDYWELTADPVFEGSTGPNWYFRLTPGIIAGVSGFRMNDIVTVVAEPGRYGVTLDRGSAHYSIADKIVLGSMWPIIFFGDNLFACNGGMQWLYFIYFNTYWGV